MHFQDERRVATDGAGVVSNAGLIGRAHFAKPGAARLEQLGNAEAAPDLEQLAARDDDLERSRSTEVVEDQDQRRGIVVDHRCRFSAAEKRKAMLQIRRATAPGAGGKTVFEG